MCEYMCEYVLIAATVVQNALSRKHSNGEAYLQTTGEMTVDNMLDPKRKLHTILLTHTHTCREVACPDPKGASKRRHCDYKTNCLALDLLLDEGRSIGRPQQVGTAITDNEEHRTLY